MNHRKEQFRKAELKSRYPNSYTDNGKYISKRMRKKNDCYYIKSLP